MSLPRGPHRIDNIRINVAKATTPQGAKFHMESIFSAADVRLLAVFDSLINAKYNFLHLMENLPEKAHVFSN